MLKNHQVCNECTLQYIYTSFQQTKQYDVLTCSQSAILNNQKTIKNLRCKLLTLGSFLTTSPSSLSALLDNFNTAVDAANTPRARLKLPLGVEAREDRLEVKAPPLGIRLVTAAAADLAVDDPNRLRLVVVCN